MHIGERHKQMLVSILLPRCWRQQLSWSYCATSQRFGLLAWYNL